MITLREHLEQYLTLRRALGFQLNDIERQVGLFCGWLEDRGQTTHTRPGGRPGCRWCADLPRI
jgi:hypothetical protein